MLSAQVCFAVYLTFRLCGWIVGITTFCRWQPKILNSRTATKFWERRSECFNWKKLFFVVLDFFLYFSFIYFVFQYIFVIIEDVTFWCSYRIKSEGKRKHNNFWLYNDTLHSRYGRLTRNYYRLDNFPIIIQFAVPDNWIGLHKFSPILSLSILLIHTNTIFDFCYISCSTWYFLRHLVYI